MAIADMVYIDAAGYHFPDYPTLRAWLVSQYQGVYGADVYLDPDSQDGQFLSILAQAFYDAASLGASVYNSFSPVTAQGTGLSRIVKLNGLTRHVPSYSTVALTIVGTAGTVITNGIASDNLNQQWVLPATVTIPTGGSITVTATAANVGAVNAAMNTITTIFTPTNGWQTVNNATAATPGAAVESDAALRLRQAQSTADPSTTVFQGTVGAVANVAGVTKVRGYENASNVTDANGVPPFNICVVTVGGANLDIANQIEAHKPPGVPTYGTTSVTVVDSKGMTNVINFLPATTATIGVVVTVKAQTGWSNTYVALIQTAVATFINSLQIGSAIRFAYLYVPAYLTGTPAGTTFYIASITIGKNGATPAATDIILGFNENPVCDPLANVSVVIT